MKGATLELPLTEVACPLCGARERRQKFAAPPFGVWSCAECELVYVSPRVTDAALLQGVYDHEYWHSAAPRERGYRDYAGDDALHLATFRRRLRALRRHLPARGNALDVGCASGCFLEVLAQEGWEVHGVEPSSTVRELTRRRLGPERVSAGSWEQLPDDGRRYDLISFWDVLEHLPDPVRALEQATERLAPGGRVCILTQNVASPWARLLGSRWQHYKHAEHLTHFSPATLERALGAAGLCTLAMGPRHAGKLVRLDFVVERAARISPWLARALSPLLRLGNPTLYVNPMDELLVVAQAAH